MLKKFIAIMALSAISCCAFAGQTVLDTSGLSDAQVAELKAHAAKIVADTANQTAGTGIAGNPAAAVTLAATWGQQAASAAEGFAKALGIAAKELGITVNDFLHTDAGKLTAALIIWKVAGASIMHMIYGIFFIATGLTISRMVYMRLFTKGYTEVEYNHLFGMFKGTKTVRIPKSISDLNTEGDWLAFWVIIIIAILSILIGGMFF